jgi:hypothetical protein
MSCATHPELCGQKEFILRGPISKPPDSGWKILSLPERAAHLQQAWLAHRGRPDSSKAAWAEYIDFLRTNGITIGMREVREISIPQWCDSDPWRCKGYRAAKGDGFLPWAAAEWEKANLMMVDPFDPEGVLETILTNLTDLIRGPQGCKKCAVRWARWVRLNPRKPNMSLTEARQYLVDAHNHTREGKPPVPFAEVAAKFNWLPE